MASLNNLLNPDSSYEPSIRLQAVLSPTTTSPTISPTEKTSESSSTAVELRPPPPRAEVVIRAHEPHPDCPDTLACLPDTDGRPQHTLPVILRCTILGSPRKRLTIREIYAAMERKYPYYKTAGPAWKQSVRHHLSLNRLFERQPRPPSDPGFGSYWTVNLEAPPGTKRPRKRGGRSNKVEYSENGPGPGLGSGLPTVIIPMQVHPPPLPAYSTPPMSQMSQSGPPSTSTMMSSSNGVHNGIASVRSLPPSHMSHPSPEDHYQTHPHHDSSHSPPQHAYSHSHIQPPPHPHQHSHMHSQSPHPQSQPPPHPHMQPSSHIHSQPLPHHHSHPHQHSVPHPHALPPSHPHSQPPSHPYGHSPTQGHPHSQPPPPPPNHPHAHSQPPPSHSNSHYHHQQSHQPPSHPPPPPLPPSSAPPNPHPQKSVSTIAKLRPVDSRSFSQTSTMRSRRLYDEDEDDMDWEDGDGPQFSDDDYSSSEDMPYQYDPRAHNRNSSSYSGSSHRTYSGSQGQSGRSVLHGAFSSYSNTDHPDSTIERLKMEMAGLRRQSQDAVNASLRLSDQLTASQEDAARAKAALKVAENMLEEEARRRLQAEQNAEEEARRRRTAEESLRQYEVQARAQRKPNAYARA